MATYKVKFVTGKNYAIVPVSGTQSITKNFTYNEAWNNSSSDEVKLAVTDNFLTFMGMLQEFRNWYNKPMTINSIYRTESFNKKVGGNAKSAHLYGTAADWQIKGHTEAQRKHVRDKWEAICKAHGVIGAINYYTNGYHLEAFSNLYYGASKFALRDYRGKKGDW